MQVCCEPYVERGGPAFAWPPCGIRTKERNVSDKVKASHILLMYAGSEGSSATRSKEEARQQMDGIKQQVDGGEDFAALAKQNSDCPSGKSGGDLGSFGRGQMVPAFDEVTFALAVSGTSDVFETGFGYHIVQRTG